MALFSPTSNLVARGSLLLLLAGGCAAVVLVFVYGRGSYATGEGMILPQPVPFSHAHHVGGLGLDCRFCHTAVEEAASAGMPPTTTCMGCHRQLWPEADVLAPIRQSVTDGSPLAWLRVYDLPDFVYFDHSIHVAGGVGCEECHGRIDRQPITHLEQPLHMRWCLGCHRDPAPHLRPRDAVFVMGWAPEEPRRALGERLLADRHIDLAALLDCTACHR